MTDITLPYNDYGGAMRRRLGGRVQKLAIDAHLGCPHRNSESGEGGCTFCLGEAFTPSYCTTHSTITSQLDSALRFHAARGRKADIYLAYFQAGTNTYAPVERLRNLYLEALAHPSIGGIIIGTRPDCISSEILQLLEDLSHNHYVAVEYGIESTSDETLRHVNRGHDYATAANAVAQTKSRGIDVGAHFILGLPGDTYDDIISGIETINALNLDFVKFHQLQIYRHTPIADEWHTHPERFIFAEHFNTERYANLVVDILRRLHPSIAVERFITQAPRHLLLDSPLRGIRPDDFRKLVVEQMRACGATQGDMLRR